MSMVADMDTAVFQALNGNVRDQPGNGTRSPTSDRRTSVIRLNPLPPPGSMPVASLHQSAPSNPYAGVDAGCTHGETVQAPFTNKPMLKPFVNSGGSPFTALVDTTGNPSSRHDGPRRNTDSTSAEEFERCTFDGGCDRESGAHLALAVTETPSTKETGDRSVIPPQMNAEALVGVLSRASTGQHPRVIDVAEDALCSARRPRRYSRRVSNVSKASSCDSTTLSVGMPDHIPSTKLPWDRQPSAASNASSNSDGDQSPRDLPVLPGKNNSRWARANWWAMQESKRRKEDEVSDGRSRRQLPAPMKNLGSMVGVASNVHKMKQRFRKGIQGLSSLRPSDNAVSAGVAVEDVEAANVPPSPSKIAMRPVSFPSSMNLFGASDWEESWSGQISDFASPRSLHRMRSWHDSLLDGEMPLKEMGWRGRVVHRIHVVLRSDAYSVVFLLLTLYALFGEDAYVLADPPVTHDLVIYSISTAAFFAYSLDLAARSLVEKGYAWSFLFWLDILATVSLAPSAIHALGLTTHSAGLQESLHLLRSGRAATTGARLARFVRVLHLANRVLAVHSMHRGSVSQMAQSIDRHLSRHVITAVGAMLLIVLGLSFVGEVDPSDLLERDLDVLDAAWRQTGGERDAFAEFLEPFEGGLEKINHHLIYLKLQGEDALGDPEAHLQLRGFPRQFEILQAACGAEEGAAPACEMHLESKGQSWAVATQNIILVASLLAVLGLIAAVLSSPARKELLTPIERIVETMDQITLQPWKKLETTVEDTEEHVLSVNSSLKRVGNLLQLGFGEAGMRIISKSLYEGEIDFKKKGNVVYAIFGFCDIRNFTDCTEVLGADIVNLVNNVATHVHQAVIDNGGAPNKNIGDAFLLVWKPKGDTVLEQVADSALRSNVETMIEMQRCKLLRRWEARADVQARMPGFRVSMGFGLHYGWAIEGAIGTHHKIDASYLSSSVNLASRLEAATKQYGTPILLSGDLHHLLSDKVRGLCRLVDRVTVKGSNNPLLLWTYDAPLLRCRGGDVADNAEVASDAPHEEFFATFKPSISDEFRLRWAKAVSRYLGGQDGKQADWARALAGLNKCLAMRPADGPATALVRVIHSLGEKDKNGSISAPSDWEGFRALTEK